MYFEEDTHKTFDMLSYVMRQVCTTFAFSWLYVMRGTVIIKKGRHFGINYRGSCRK